MSERNAMFDRHGYAVVRAIVLATASLAIVGVLFALYQYSAGLDQPDPAPPDRPLATQPADVPTVADAPAIATGKGALRGGERIRLRQYEPDGRVKLELEVLDFRPIGDSDDENQEIELDKPEIRLATRDGQRLRVRADRGLLEVRRSGPDSFSPHSGRLSGNVRFDIDRLSEEERLKLPPEQRDIWPPPERLIQLSFETVAFDITTSRIETTGPFSVRMAEADIDGVGMRFAFNDVDNRLELLEITKEGVIDLNDVSGFSGEATPGGGGPAGEPGDDGSARPAGDEVQPYVGTIAGNVSVRSFEDGVEVGRLLAEALDVKFDFARTHREVMRSGRPQPSDQPVEPTGPTARQAPTRRLTIKWDGKLLIQPESAEDAAWADPAGRRVRLVATGREVRLSGERGELICGRLEAHGDTRKAWISGPKGRQVVFTDGRGATLVGENVFVDQAEGVVQIDGPGRLTRLPDTTKDPPGDGLDVRFEDSAMVRFGQYETKDDAATAEKRIAGFGDFIESVAFRGDAVIRTGDSVLAGDLVTLALDRPARETGTSLLASPRSLRAQGRVLLARGRDRVTCAELDMTFQANPDGKPLPRVATARGDVLVTQADLTVTAGEYLNLDFESVEKPKPPFDSLAVWLQAWKDGDDPTLLDWAQKRALYDSEVSYRTVLAGISARGGVTAFDPTKGLDVSAASLQATMVNGRDLGVARFVGPEGRDAFVGYGEFAIRGHRIDADFENQNVDVHGPGALRLTASKGLDGTVSENPQLVDVSWTRELSFRGRSNTARFVGAVHAASRRRIGSGDGPAADLETATLDGEEMIIEFVDVEAVAPPARHASPWWIFEPVARRWTKVAEPQKNAMLAKEPTYITVSRGVVCVFARTDAADRVISRARFSSSKLTADLRTELIALPSAGTLLIEDYRPRRPGGKPVPPADEDTGGTTTGLWDGGGGLPSQTFMSWSGSLSFHAARNRADLRDDVVLLYRAGSEMVMADELLRSYQFAPEAISGASRRTRLDCGELLIEFSEGAGLGGMSARDLRQLEATGGVVLVDDEYTVEAYRVVKYEDSDLLRVFGRGGRPAEIYSDDPNGPRLTAPEFNFDLVTGRTEVPDVQLRIRPPRR